MPPPMPPHAAAAHAAAHAAAAAGVDSLVKRHAGDTFQALNEDIGVDLAGVKFFVIGCWEQFRSDHDGVVENAILDRAVGHRRSTN